MQTINSTEHQIIEAARKIFIKKGLSGARMQDIADEAGINKAMLHYYYRSKDKLFDIIFQEAVDQMMARINSILKGNMPLNEKIAAAVENYITSLSENPYLPIFVFNEANQHPERLVERFVNTPKFPNVQQFMMEIVAEMEKGTIRRMPPHQLLINLISMCVFPFAAKPIVQSVFRLNDPQFAQLMEERKKVVTEFILMSLRP